MKTVQENLAGYYVTKAPVIAESMENEEKGNAFRNDIKSFVMSSMDPVE